jgi:hypothetical protein
MATATPSPSPNPNALRFALDTTLDGTMSFANAGEAEAAGDPFGTAVFACEGVASIFGVNDFVTISREAGADWDPIIEAVQAAARDHL